MKTSYLTRLRSSWTPFGRPISQRSRTICCESSPPGRAKVKFSIPHHVEFGQSIYVAGSEGELGSWQLEESYPLEWTQGDVWTGVIELPSKMIEYKYVTVNEDGSQPEWQPCENLVVDIKIGDLMEITDCWDGFTQETTTTKDDDVTKIEAVQEEVKVYTDEELEIKESSSNKTTDDDDDDDDDDKDEDEEEKNGEEEGSAEVDG